MLLTLKLISFLAIIFVVCMAFMYLAIQIMSVEEEELPLADSSFDIPTVGRIRAFRAVTAALKYDKTHRKRERGYTWHSLR